MPRKSALIVAVFVSLRLTCAVVIAAPIDDVSQATYTTYLNNSLFTHNGNNRGIGGIDHDPARTSIYDSFNSFGLATTLESFTYNGSTYYNVVGTLLGTSHPGNVYIVGAHYDSLSNPGADDDGSGVAGVVEAARVLSKYAFDATLVFIGFDREEQGLKGSTDYATRHSGDSILGMVSLDMIAYNPVGADHNKVLIYGRNASDSVKQGLSKAVNDYGGGIVPSAQGPLDQSDHAPFEWVGKPAALLIEYSVWSNPQYHHAGDSVDTAGYIDYVYATALTRSTVGYLASSAGQVTQAEVPEPCTVLIFSAFALLGIVRRRSGEDGRRAA